MPQGTFTNSWISQAANILFCGSAAPDTTKFYLGLANTNALTRANTIVDFVSNELLATDGYARSQLILPNNGSYNTSNNRQELPTATITFTAQNTWQFQTVFLLANGHPVASLPFTSSNVNSATDRITIANHPWVSGDRLIFTADSTATLPTGINQATVYQVLSPTTNDFALGQVVSSTPINIQDTGSGTFRARSANGMVAAFAVESSLITLLAASSYSYQIPLVLLNTGLVSGN
ncbi:MAG: hypothetical protein V7L26_17600 [Nostoc sp.]|uniref:hypothetical protein n=1 Tax=Nostoc sp. TaxID=1180 RepID=UPI002FF74F5E